MLLFAGGEIIDHMKFWARVPEYLQHADLKFCLKRQCGEAIRKHLIKLNPHENLLGRSPKLGLHSSVENSLTPKPVDNLISVFFFQQKK